MINYTKVQLFNIFIILTVISAPYGHAQDREMSPAELKRLAEEKNKIYAPWDPADIDELRREVGLIGPGPQSPIPEARFPSYLKKPNTVEEMMPQALAAVAQKGGRTPLGLADPGDIVLIVVPWNADPLIQQAMEQAFASRKVEARILYENDLVGVSKEDMQAILDATSLFKAGDGQQESAYFWEFLGAWPDFNVYKEFVTQMKCLPNWIVIITAPLLTPSLPTWMSTRKSARYSSALVAGPTPGRP
jgi:hypothetical protein